MGLFGKKVDYFNDNSEYYYIESIFRNILNENDYRVVRAASQYYLMFDKTKMYTFPGDKFSRAAGIIISKEDAYLAATHPEYVFQDFVDKKTNEGKCTWVPLNNNTFNNLMVAKEKADQAIKRGETMVDGKPIITSDDIIELVQTAKEARGGKGRGR